MRLLYSALFYVLLPAIIIRLWLRGRKAPNYRKRIKERFGFIQRRKGNRPCLWFHTVSVGEFIAARPLIHHYLEQGKYDVVVTTMTPTGSDRVTSTFADRVIHYYFPYDLTPFISRFLHRVRPDKYICMETELWPNTIQCCFSRNIPVILANGRLSEKSAAGYRKFAKLTRPMLAQISTAAIQNLADAERFIELGLNKTSAHITGSIKFDLDIENTTIQSAETLKANINAVVEAPILIAASTHKGEDEIILKAFSHLRQAAENIRLIIVPRHPERFDTVTALCESTGFSVARRSQHKSENFDIMVGDTMGELMLMLGAADYVFIGGSLVSNGGHNYIEPAAWSLPIISGPSTFNFLAIARELQDASALTIVDNEHELAGVIQNYLANPELAKEHGQAGKRIADNNRGALARLITLINES